MSSMVRTGTSFETDWQRFSSLKRKIGPATYAGLYLAASVAAGQQLMPQLAYAQAGPPELFEHGPASSGDRGRNRGGTVVGTVKLKADLKRTKKVSLNLPNVPPGELTVESVSERSGQDYSVKAGGKDADAELVVTDQGVTGTVRIGTVSYGLQALGDGSSALVRLDQEPKHHPNKPEAPRQSVAPRQPGTAGAEIAAADTGARVNVLVVYTAAAASWTGDIGALVQLAEDKTNAAMANSQVPSRIEIVHSEQVSYNEDADMAQDLYRLTDKADGFMDSVHALRDQYKADLVALLVDPGNYGGIAWVNSSEAYGFSVTAVNAVYYDTFQHELGHNWWMRHNPEEDASTSPIPYAHGYCYTPGGWRTVMSYDMGCSGRINQYSSPSLTYNGVPTGTATTSDNARVAREKAEYIANFRLGDPEPPPQSWRPWVGLGGGLASFPECEPTGTGTGIACWARSASGTLVWNRSADGNAWSGWTDLGGSVAGAPDCLVRGGRIDCFATTAANRLAQRTYDGSAWGAWADRGGAVVAQPSCVPASSGLALDCFATGTDKALWRRQFDGTAWKAWQKVGGTTTLRPECVRVGTAIHCFVVDGSKNLRTRRLSGGTWGAWTQIGAGFGIAPQCLVSSGKMDCFAQSSGKQLLKGYYDGASWSSWNNLGGDVYAQPNCSRLSTGFDCYWTTSTFKLVRRQRSGTTWQPEADLGGAVQQKPACLVRNDGARVDCLARGTDNTLQQRSYH